jgi:hypothetical protein
MALLVTPSADTDFIACVRSAVGIARALGLALVLPRWRSPSGAWLPLESLIESSALASLVQVLTEAEARSRSTSLARDGLRVIRVCSHVADDSEGAGEVQQRLVDYLTTIGLSLPFELPAASLTNLAQPLRTRAECAACFGETRPGMLVLPALRGTHTLSASATVLSVDQRSTLDRALATPSLAVQALAGRLVRRSLSHEPLAAETEAIAHAEEHTLIVVWPQGATASTAAAVASSANALLAGQSSPSPATSILVVPEAAVRRPDCTSSDTSPAPIEAQAEGLARALRAFGDAPPLVRALVDRDVPSSQAVLEGRSDESVLERHFALRWICCKARLLLLPPVEAAPSSLVAARQALGKPVDHAYVSGPCLSNPSRAPASTASVGGASQRTPTSSQWPPIISPLPLPPPPPSAPNAPASVPAPHPSLAAMLSQSSEGGTPASLNDVSELGFAQPAAAAARSDAVLQLMATKLAPELRSKVLDFHPEVATLHALSRLGAEPTSLETYEGFLSRTRPLLRRLPFAPAVLEGAERVAVIVEPRAAPEMVQRTADVIRNVGCLLHGSGSCAWAIQLFHGTTNLEPLSRHFSAVEWARVACVNLGVDNLRSSQEYSQLLCSHWFWSRVGAEVVLIFQEDALLLGPSLERFVDAYDYVGAPFDPDDGWVRGKPWLAAVGGNGGLSLRRRSHAIACLDRACWQRGQFEDAFFIEILQQMAHRVAPADVAKQFAVERLRSSRPVGLHKAYNYQSHAALEEMLAGLEEAYASRLAGAAV